MPRQQAANMMHSKLDPMKEVAKMIRNYLESIIA
jgi:hypothetical protein